MADEIKPTENLSIIDEAKKVRDEIKAENDRRANLLAEEQKLRAENMLASTSGGNIPITPPKVETAKEYAERVMKGEVKPQ